MIAAVVTAAGSSVRMGGLKKEYRPLEEGLLDDEGRPFSVLASAVEPFLRHRGMGVVVLSVPRGGEERAREALPRSFLREGQPVPLVFVEGGASRRASVHAALRALAPFSPDLVLIHDGARPWLDSALIDRVAEAARATGAAIPVLPLVETPKEIDGAGTVTRHLRRSEIVSAQTPQGFAFPEILDAHESAAVREREEGIEYTDDAEVWADFGGTVATVAGSPRNRKITFPEDLS
ncbi:MAG TPA: 2-C-methyl-D-erythritol 4-phosphate cytidylyltransferase [Treponema sp.]|nr:MAG: 2-C-methyl-D-erythritol 4-phosphate cytidylyltransferase [Treponema sp. GWC1_61_84]HCM27082.1 2-C-methyl-D-erythritol 4-phosphate cytidylyltransferase [Treponema sp.]